MEGDAGGIGVESVGSVPALPLANGDEGTDGARLWEEGGVCEWEARGVVMVVMGSGD